jgi:deoxyribodipyrimidine photo-lyase
MNIPLYTITHTPRRSLPERVLGFMHEINATCVYANMEYEVDELRRDIQLCTLAKNHNIHVAVVHDKLVIEPGVLSTKQGKPYMVRHGLNLR